jgi:hypothetical protein
MKDISIRFILPGRMLACVILIAAMSAPLAAQDMTVDISACRGMSNVLKAMRNGAPLERVAALLEALLETPPYKIMFKHYNRSWRPNHLPEAVFKRMILSLRFAGEYAPGENERADAMRARWTEYYPDLSPYESLLDQLESANLPKLIREGVVYAQGWLPPGWKIPDFALIIVPNGGSPAFTIENAQGYDLLQLSQGRPGILDVTWLVGTVAHESHHLGMRSGAPDSLSPAEATATRVLSLCIAEGVATEFISGPPEGRAPAVPGVPYHVFTEDLAKVWNKLVGEEEDILKHLTVLLDQATAGELTEETFNAQLRDYWLNGTLGRAYVLGADMFGAIYLAFGQPGVFTVMKDPRRLFEIYNAALEAKPEALKRCVRVPEASVKKALAIGIAKRTASASAG